MGVIHNRKVSLGTGQQTEAVAAAGEIEHRFSTKTGRFLRSL